MAEAVNGFAAMFSVRFVGLKKIADIFERIHASPVYLHVVNIVQWERYLLVVLTVCLVLGHVGRPKEGGLHVL